MHARTDFRHQAVEPGLRGRELVQREVALAVVDDVLVICRWICGEGRPCRARTLGHVLCTLYCAACASGLTTSRSTFTCGGLVAHQLMQSAMSSAVNGSATPA